MGTSFGAASLSIYGKCSLAETVRQMYCDGLADELVRQVRQAVRVCAGIIGKLVARAVMSVKDTTDRVRYYV